MTDLEICKRIARIEYPLCTLEWCKDTLFLHDEIYNPLTDKALCFDLMVKYDIRLSQNNPEDFVVMYTHCRGTESTSPQRAICLAIIEAHKG